jgi:hypothetical protein
MQSHVGDSAISLQQWFECTNCKPRDEKLGRNLVFPVS